MFAQRPRHFAGQAQRYICGTRQVSAQRPGPASTLWAARSTTRASHARCQESACRNPAGRVQRYPCAHSRCPHTVHRLPACHSQHAAYRLSSLPSQAARSPVACLCTIGLPSPPHRLRPYSASSSSRLAAREENQASHTTRRCLPGVALPGAAGPRRTLSPTIVPLWESAPSGCCAIVTVTVTPDSRLLSAIAPFIPQRAACLCLGLYGADCFSKLPMPLADRRFAVESPTGPPATESPRAASGRRPAAEPNQLIYG